MSEQNTSQIKQVKKGKLIVIEGTDGSGKKTQTAKLLERLIAQGTGLVSGEGLSESAPIEAIDFPRYGTPSCYLVEKYLHGGFGTALEVGPYVGSMFYAVDRYDHSFDMKKKLEAGTILVSDRYVSASMGHQAGKIDDLKERDVYLEWLDNLEFEIFKIPRPDLTIVLYVDPETNQRLMASRPDKEYLKGKKADIHEADLEHLRKAGEAFLYVAKKFGWTIIDCAPKTAENPEGKLMSIDEIHEMIWKKVSEVLEGN